MSTPAAWLSVAFLLGAGCSDEQLIVGAGPPRLENGGTSSGAASDGGGDTMSAGGLDGSGGSTVNAGNGASGGSGGNGANGGVAGTAGNAGASSGGSDPTAGNSSGGTAGNSSGGTGGAAATAGQGGSGGDGSAGTSCPGSVTCSPSCAGMIGTECQGDDCCTSILVDGGTFERTTDITFTATVSSFRLDKYEVTVARYRPFLAARPAWIAAGNPMPGAGEHPRIPGTGWDASWPVLISPDAVGNEPPYCGEEDQPYVTHADEGNGDLPVNCVSWYDAFQFCVWDGGRLPTGTEWEFAAVGGPLQQLYPWGNTPVPSGLQDPSADYAVYNHLGDGSDASAVSFADILPVGSKPAGAGPFGHLDMAGNLAEFTLDKTSTLFPESMDPVVDWVDFLPDVDATTIRGGAWTSPPADIRSTIQLGTFRYSAWPEFGFRCARAP